MKQTIRTLLIILSVAFINAGFYMPIVHLFWTLTGYEVVELIPRWAGREFYILLLIPVCSVLLLFCLVPLFARKVFVYPLLILLNASFLFSLFEIINISIAWSKSDFSLYILRGYYLIAFGIISIDILLTRPILTKDAPLLR